MSDWNNRFTQLIRESRPNLWGNWALAPTIHAGAVGFVDPSTGAFKLVAAQVPTAEIEDTDASSSWKVSSEGVSRHVGDAKGSGTVVDPSTGLSITPEVEFTWKLTNKHSIASEFFIIKEAAVRNLGVLSDQYEWLAAEAQKVGFAQNGKIAQGFGVITQVVYAQSGLNIGSNDNDASYTLGGTAEGLHALVGEAGPKASAKAGYAYSRENRSLDKHVWPASQGVAAQTLAAIPVAYAFSSFEGTTVLPAWRGRIDQLSIHLDSKASRASNYITKAKLSYTTSGARQEVQECTIIGGLSGDFAAIPLTATNVQLELKFVGVITDVIQTFSWDVPLAQWPLGKMHLDIIGTWPGRPEATIRDDLNNRR